MISNWTSKKMSSIKSEKFDKHVKSVIQSCYFHLRNIAKIHPLLPFQHLEMVIYVWWGVFPECV